MCQVIWRFYAYIKSKKPKKKNLSSISTQSRLNNSQKNTALTRRKTHTNLAYKENSLVERGASAFTQYRSHSPAQLARDVTAVVVFVVKTLLQHVSGRNRFLANVLDQISESVRDNFQKTRVD